MKKIFLITMAILYAVAATVAQTGPTGECTGPMKGVSPFHETILLGPTPKNPTDPPPPPPPPPNPPGTDCVVYWVHGLGGGPGAWGKVANASAAANSGDATYPSRKIVSFRPSYSEVSDLENAGNTLQTGTTGLLSFDNMITATQQASPQNFIIAHSQGGLVSRKLDQLYAQGQTQPADQRFNGIVTFGTPHGGAQMANNVANGKAAAWVTQFCLDVSAAPLPILSNIPFLGINITPPMLCSLAPAALSGFTKPLLSEYQTGQGTGLAAMNAGPAQTPFRVAFFGQEEDEVLWREVYHLGVVPPVIINGVTIHIFGKAAADYDLFGANDDDKAMEAIGEAKDFYGLMESWTFGDMSAAWGKGQDALINANNTWEILIGAAHINYNGQCNCYGLEYIDGMTPAQWDHYVQMHYMDPANQYTYESGDPTCGGNPDCTYALNYSAFISKPSDGVVPADSQAAFPGVNATAKMDGSNHQSERNDQNTKARLNELWTGGHGDFFITLAR